MSIVLRVLAGLVMVLGVASLLAIVDLHFRGVLIYRGWVGGGFYEALSIAGVAIGAGGMLWALTRLAYRPAEGLLLPQNAVSSSSEAAEARSCSAGSFLRVMAWLQIGIGIVFFAGLYYMLTTPPTRPGGDTAWGQIWLAAIFSWGFACLGGILLARTRIAYPPTPRA